MAFFRLSEATKRLLGLALACLILWLSGCSSAQQNATEDRRTLEQDVIKISQAKIFDRDNPADVRLVTLPDRYMRSPRRFVNYRMEAEFEVSEPQRHLLWAMYVMHMPHGGNLSVNGIDIGEVPTSTATTTVWLTKPYLFQVPATLLKPGKNLFTIEWSENQSLSMMSVSFFGPIDIITRVYQQRYFWQNTLAQAALVHALVIAAILLGIFSLRRHQSSYALMGVGAIGFSVIVFTFMLPPMPSWFYPYWRSIHITGIAVFTSCAWLFLIKESEPQNRWYPRLCIAWAALGPISYLIHFWLTDLTYFAAFEPVWGMTSGAIGVYALGTMVWSMRSQWSWRKFIFLIATAIAIVMGIADIALQSTSKSLFGNVGYGLQAVSPLWFTALTVVLVLDFVASLTVQEELHDQLQSRLAAQQIELTELHEKDRIRDRELAAQNERQRIMQDMHDGLGSQLITTLALSERGALDKEQTSLMLRECIDDLRLAIDTTASDGAPFVLAAANLRFRMDPRLRAAGLALIWDSVKLGEDLPISASHTLAILRIIQEALSNALKHGRASQVYVKLASSASTLTVEIKDDGRGFNPESIVRGKGLSGMERRARSIGARFELDGSMGARVRVELPL